LPTMVQMTCQRRFCPGVTTTPDGAGGASADVVGVVVALNGMKGWHCEYRSPSRNLESAKDGPAPPCLGRTGRLLRVEPRKNSRSGSAKCIKASTCCDAGFCARTCISL